MIEIFFVLHIHIYLFFVLAALILEEIAIDSHNKAMEDRLLHEAQELHLQSLALAKKAFGENNVQTAKHYGNLGRLYQSMRNYEVRISTQLFCEQIGMFQLLVNFNVGQIW